MTRAIALDLVKYLAVNKTATVAQLMEHAGTHESNVREWLYAMDALGMARVDGVVPRTIKKDCTGRGIRMIQRWRWLL